MVLITGVEKASAILYEAMSIQLLAWNGKVRKEYHFLYRGTRQEKTVPKPDRRRRFQESTH